MNSFEKELFRRLDELKASKTEVITMTVLTPDDYMRQMGYFQCIRDVIAICEQIDDEIMRT